MASAWPCGACVGVLRLCWSPRELRVCMQGPVAHVWVEEVSLGCAGSLRKLVDGVAGAWGARQLQLPLSVHGITVQLRARPANPAFIPAPSPGAAATKPARKAGVGGRGGKQWWLRLPCAGLGLGLAAAALRGLAALLSALPLRLERVVIVCEVPSPSSDTHFKSPPKVTGRGTGLQGHCLAYKSSLG